MWIEPAHCLTLGLLKWSESYIYQGVGNGWPSIPTVFLSVIGYTVSRVKFSIMSVKDKCNENTLKALRKKLRINQTQFAKALGVRQQTVSEWERGIYRPALSIEQIKTLEDMLSRVGLKFRDLPDDLSQ